MKTDLNPDAGCARCGTCCRKGGPALHREDRHLVESGVLHTRDLTTIRRGEWVHDPIQNRLLPARREIIKIKGQGGRWTCRCFDPATRSCRIYEERPLECRLLACWNTERIECAYARGRLVRRDLVGGIAGLWELVAAHEQRCDHRGLQRLLAPRPASSAARRRREAAEIINYDAALRREVVARTGIEAEMLEFLFGRPLSRVVHPPRGRAMPSTDPAGT
jgi:Fe-S-cluster containining protein